jgi:SsrA-binding protein
MKEPIKVAANNRKASHDYFIDETYEAGIALVGTEVKSIRAGKVSLRDSYADIQNGELFLQNMHISPYDKGSRFNHDPKRPRKLLMHKREITRLLGQTTQKGYTLITSPSMRLPRKLNPRGLTTTRSLCIAPPMFSLLIKKSSFFISGIKKA